MINEKYAFSYLLLFIVSKALLETMQTEMKYTFKGFFLIGTLECSELEELKKTS